jgi:glucose-1-phosphate adenylyltransferase
MSLEDEVLAVILAAGRGTRLFNLTKERTKPAVPFAGYRLIDIMLSNLWDSHIRKIHLLTEYKSSSLDDHVQKWDQRTGSDEFVTTIPFQMRVQEHPSRGSGDSLYNHTFNRRKAKKRNNIRRYAILSGDHVSDFDPSEMLGYNASTGAHITLCVKRVRVEEARGQLGVVIVDKDLNVIGFEEKPENPTEIPGEPGWCLANEANYITDAAIFDDAVDEFLPDETKTRYDLSRDIITPLVEEKNKRGLKINAYVHEGYWADVGTLKALFQANMNLLSLNPEFNIYNDKIWYKTFVEKFGGQGPKITELAGETKPIIANAGSIISGVAKWCVLSYGVVLEVGSVSNRVVYADQCIVNQNAKVINSMFDKECEVGAGAAVDPSKVDVWLEGEKIAGPNQNNYRVSNLGNGHLLLQRSNDGRNLEDIVDRHGGGIFDSSGYVKEMYMEDNKDNNGGVLEFVLTPKEEGDGRIAVFSKYSVVPDSFVL